MSNEDYVSYEGYHLAYRCPCGEVLLPGVKKGSCTDCWTEERRKRLERERER